MEIETAAKINSRALSAISELISIFNEIDGNVSEIEYTEIKRGIGLSIGLIQTDICDYICKRFPELDDLNNDFDS